MAEWGQGGGVMTHTPVAQGERKGGGRLGTTYVSLGLLEKPETWSNSVSRMLSPKSESSVSHRWLSIILVISQWDLKLVGRKWWRPHSSILYTLYTIYILGSIWIGLNLLPWLKLLKWSAYVWKQLRRKCSVFVTWLRMVWWSTAHTWMSTTRMITSLLAVKFLGLPAKS